MEKKGPKTKKKEGVKTGGASKTKAKLYKCNTCGLITTEKGHLCSPQEVKKAYTCEYCGAAASDPRHICKPKVAELNYVCEACGRIATDRNHLCEPKRIR